MADNRSHTFPAKFQSVSFLVVMVITWSFSPSAVISRPDKTWYNIGPQVNQSVNTVVTIANITPPTNSPTRPPQPATPAVSPIQPSNPVKPPQPAGPGPLEPTKPAQPVTPGQKGSENPSGNSNVTSTSPATAPNPTTAPTPTTETTATKESTQIVNMSDIKSVGCFRDSYMEPRPLPKLIADFRDDSENASKRENYNDTILACAKKADEMGFGFFGIQGNGECWSGEDSEETYARDGPSTDCHHGVGKSGSNYVYRFVGKRAKPCKNCGPARTMCFPASAQVQLQNGFHTSMKNLKIGDQIQTIDMTTNQIIFTEVIAFLHKDEKAEGFYHVLELEDGKKVVLSAHHLIYTSKTDQSQAMTVVYAEDVIPGDFVRVSGQADAYKRVIRVTTSQDIGLYAPMTRHGTMLVDGVLLSCYAHWKAHDIAHKVMAPVRVWYDITSTVGTMLSGIGKGLSIGNATSDGIHWYASFLMHLSQSLPSSFANFMGR